MSQGKYRIRKATVKDIPEVQKLINLFARREQMLPRSLHELYESIRDIFVCDSEGKILGTCSLHIHWEDLAEIRSLAVRKEATNMGIGTRLVRRAMAEAKRLGVNRVFVLTYTPEFFIKLGFQEIDKSTLPQKIWGECLKCHKFPNCDEVALIREI